MFQVQMLEPSCLDSHNWICYGPPHHMCVLFLVQHSVRVSCTSDTVCRVACHLFRLKWIKWYSAITRFHCELIQPVKGPQPHIMTHVKFQFVLHREHPVLTLQRRVCHWWTFIARTIQGNKVFSEHAMNIYKGKGGLAPLILNHCTRRRLVVNLTPRPI